ncbi:MAG: BatD family protein [Saprospiraceae bacterium]|nr:protein BatD [Lewinella sp.]
MLLRRFLLFVIIMTPFCVSAQEPVFEATTNARQVVTNGYFEVSFTLKNAQGSNFQAPSFTDFTVVSGPSRSFSTTIVNGKMNQELTFEFTLQPKRTGNLTIGRATILVGNNRLSSKPITVEVVEGKAAAGNTDEEVFIRAEISTNEAWVGQQIVLDYKLYTNIQIENYNIVEESDYQGFYAQNVRRYDSRLMREVVNNKQYVTKVIKRVALFPQRAGRLTIDPLNVQLGALDENQRRNGFFLNRQLRRIPALTDPVTVDVRSLPADAPAGFTGAVGNFEVNSQINRRNFSTDDAISIRLSVRGDGDTKRIQPPSPQFPSSFEVYEPKVTRENTYETEGLLFGEKEIEYLLVPRDPGDYQLQTTFSWFDPDSASYVTYLSPVFDVNITQGSLRPDRPVVKKEGASSPTEIRYIKNETAISSADRSFPGSAGFWILIVLPFLAVGGTAFWRKASQQRSSLDPTTLRHRSARKVALKRLEQAKALLGSSDSRAFYDAIEHAMDGYVCDKLRIPQSELSREVVRQRLETLNVEEQRIERFLGIKKNCEIALYAGMDNSAAMQETYDQTLALIADIEASI